MKRSTSIRGTASNYLPRFGAGFLEDYARRIMVDPKIALVELVANCWDAGANRIEIVWPEPAPNNFEIIDDGTGMSYEEFCVRWLELSYNRRAVQGEDVVFPEGNRKSLRKAYGTNGKGRHSMFCFANEYIVETWKDGEANRFKVKRASGISNTPFTVEHEDAYPKEGHGTRLVAELVRSHLEESVVCDLIGSKFIADPSFGIFINGNLVELTSLEHLFHRAHFKVPHYGSIWVSCIDSHKTGRTSKQHGVAWWVNRRLVGESSWKGFDEEAYLDARTIEAKRYTFVAEADILAEDVMEDWSYFKDTDRFHAVKGVVREVVFNWLRDLMKDVHKSKKIAAATKHKKELGELSKDSRYYIGQFVDEIQGRLTTLDDRVLAATMEVLSKLEKARSGYALLEQLAKLDPSDLDELNRILSSWSIQEARIVLDELGRRLKLIQSLENLVESPSADELHDIQPLFEQALWIFGPEYESLLFMSNRSLATVIAKLFKDEALKSVSRRRPDFVALPDSSIGVYTRDSYNYNGDVDGIAKVLILELKKGGFEVTVKELRQVQDYATEIRRSGKISTDTQVIGFVLGTTLADDARDPIKVGELVHTTINARTYSTVLRQAHARTFNLLRKIEEAKGVQLSDPDIENVLSIPDQPGLFETSTN